MKPILSALLMMLLFTGARAGNVTEQEARLDLSRKVQNVFEEEMRETKNYFYQNDIRIMREDVEIIFLVNNQNQLEVVRVKCRDCKADGLVRHVFAEHPVRANGCLQGRVLRIRVDLRYKAW
ncbi:MAG: hypothetical protein AB7D05_01315 [Mangrovibacterium sp.]